MLTLKERHILKYMNFTQRVDSSIMAAMYADPEHGIFKMLYGFVVTCGFLLSEKREEISTLFMRLYLGLDCLCLKRNPNSVSL